MGQVAITVLVENTAGGGMGIIGEYGFAALIEKDGEKILLDTGQGMALQNNARALQVNLAQVGKIVLSHGHYDHTGGLMQALLPPRGVEVIAHPDVFDSKYAGVETPAGKVSSYIGMRFDREFLENGLKCRFSLKKEFGEISPGIYFSGEIERQTDFEHPDPRLLVKRNEDFVTDPLLDDISLLIETDKGPVILLGCAHSGAVNIMKHFANITGYKEFFAIIGGTHLGPFGAGEQLEKTMDAFDEFGLKLIAVSHCTGQLPAAIMYNRFKDRFAFANSGWKAVFK